MRKPRSVDEDLAQRMTIGLRQSSIRFDKSGKKKKITKAQKQRAKDEEHIRFCNAFNLP